MDYLHPTGQTFPIKGRGLAHVYRIDPPQPAGEIRKLVGREIDFEGRARRIRAVETFAVGDAMLVKDCNLLLADEDA